MKIAYLFGTYPKLSETFLQREMDSLRKRGFDIEIWANAAKPPGQQIYIPTLLRLGKTPYFGRNGYYRRVGRYWSQHQLGTVDHIHSTWAGDPALIAKAAAEERKIPWSFSGHSHDILVNPRNIPAKLKSAAFATSCTHQGVEFLQTQIPTNPSKVLFAPHGLPLEQYPFTAHQHFYPPLRIVAVGRLVEKKGFEYLLRALKMLQNSDLTAEVTIVGDGPLRRKLEELTSELQLTHLRFEGEISPHKARAQMQRSSLLVAPCVIGKNGDHDGLPNVLLEAAALGLPILTTPIGGTSDLINEKTGWMCRPNDATDLAKKLQHIFANPQMAFEKAQAARIAVEAHYDVMDNVRILADAFQGNLS